MNSLQRGSGNIKIICQKHGAHFPEDFDPKCPKWKEWKINKFTDEDKKRVWNWIFSLPIDEFAIKYNIALSPWFIGHKISKDKFVNEFEKTIPGYKDLDDEKRKEYQREFFLKKKELEVSDLPWYKLYWRNFIGDL